jgi:hypothetical protein
MAGVAFLLHIEARHGSISTLPRGHTKPPDGLGSAFATTDPAQADEPGVLVQLDVNQALGHGLLRWLLAQSSGRGGYPSAPTGRVSG